VCGLLPVFLIFCFCSFVLFFLFIQEFSRWDGAPDDDEDDKVVCCTFIVCFLNAISLCRTRWLNPMSDVVIVAVP